MWIELMDSANLFQKISIAKINLLIFYNFFIDVKMFLYWL